MDFGEVAPASACGVRREALGAISHEVGVLTVLGKSFAAGGLVESRSQFVAAMRCFDLCR